MFTPTDSYSNTYTLLLSVNFDDGLNVEQGLWYCSNPTVGSSHNWTPGAGATGSDVYCLAFSGAKSSSPFDTPQYNGSGFVGIAGTSHQFGGITPSVNGCLIVTGLASLNINNQITGGGWSTPESHDFLTTGWLGGGIAWMEQTTATSINPTWTFTDFMSTDELVGSTASFLPPSGTPVPALEYPYRSQRV
jgi:hypothetical protein